MNTSDNNSSSEDLREDSANGDLPFDMELSGLNINETSSPSPSAWNTEDMSAWAARQGFVGRYAKMLQRPSSFDLVPESGKLVVLDVSLSVRVAFEALRENGIKSAPLWSTEEREFIGLVSISDFVEILLQCYSDAVSTCGGPQQHQQIPMSPQQQQQQPDPVKCDAYIQQQLQLPLAQWRERLKPTTVPYLIFVTPEDSVLEASAVMLRHNVHRVAVMEAETHTVMFLLTHSVILNYLLHASAPATRAPLMQQSLQELGFLQDSEVTARVSCCMLNTPFIDVLRLFSRDKCSAVPLVDRDGRMMAVVTKSDIRGLLRPGLWMSLQQPVGDLLAQRYRGQLGPDVLPRVVTRDDNMETVMQKLAQRDVYRLFILDHNQRIVGKVTLSRFFRFLLSVR